MSGRYICCKLIRKTVKSIFPMLSAMTKVLLTILYQSIYRDENEIFKHYFSSNLCLTIDDNLPLLNLKSLTINCLNRSKLDVFSDDKSVFSFQCELKWNPAPCCLGPVCCHGSCLWGNTLFFYHELHCSKFSTITRVV